MQQIAVLNWGSVNTLRKVAQLSCWASPDLTSIEVEAMLKMAKDNKLIGTRASRTTWVQVDWLKRFLQENCSTRRLEWEDGIYEVQKQLRDGSLDRRSDPDAAGLDDEESKSASVASSSSSGTGSSATSSGTGGSSSSKSSSVAEEEESADLPRQCASESEEQESSESRSQSESESEEEDSSGPLCQLEAADEVSCEPASADGSDSAHLESSESEGEQPARSPSSMPWSGTLASQQLKLGNLTGFALPKKGGMANIHRRTKLGIQPDANPTLKAQVASILEHFCGDINPARTGGNLEDSSLKKLSAVIDLYMGYLVVIQKFPKNVSSRV